MTCSRSFLPLRCRQLVAIDGIDWRGVALDVAFCALPHATTQKVIKDLMAKSPSTKVVDLSADFRLSDTAAYAKWYGHESSRAGAAKGSRLRFDRNSPARDQACAAGRQSRLLHDMRAVAARPAHQEQGDRTRRDRCRCQVRHDRCGPCRQRGHAILRSFGGLSCLRCWPSSAYGRARPGVLARRRAGGRCHIHPASGANESGYFVDDLYPWTAGSDC